MAERAPRGIVFGNEARLALLRGASLLADTAGGRRSARPAAAC